MYLYTLYAESHSLRTNEGKILNGYGLEVALGLSLLLQDSQGHKLILEIHVFALYVYLGNIVN